MEQRINYKDKTRTWQNKRQEQDKAECKYKKKVQDKNKTSCKTRRKQDTEQEKQPNNTERLKLFCVLCMH